MARRTIRPAVEGQIAIRGPQPHAGVLSKKGKDAVSSMLARHRQTGELSCTGGQMPDDSPAEVTVSSRTKGKVRYDRLPTGEVVASIVREGPGCSVTTDNSTRTAVSSPTETGVRRRRLAADACYVLPDDYPINQSNVTAVVEEAHRATQSMRILLTSMREELRRAGGLTNEGVRWTDGQLGQRTNIAKRLAVAYQSYRKSISDIENVRFHAGNSITGNAGIDLRVSPGSSAHNSTMQRAQDFPAYQGRCTISNASGSGEPVIDLTD